MNNSLYVIDSGKVRILSPTNNELRVVGNGGTFGEIHGLVPNINVVHTVKTITNCELLAIDHKALGSVLNNFPDTRREIYQHVLKMIKASLRYYSAYGDGHNYDRFSGEFMCIIHAATGLADRDLVT